MLTKFLLKIEKIGNKIPDVSVLFLFGLAFVLLASFGLSLIEFDYFLIKADGSAGDRIVIKNYLLLENFFELLSKMVENFINFPPLAITIVAALGIGIAEESGFLKVSLTKLSSFVPKSLVVPLVILISIFAHIVSGAAYVFLIPIGALLFLSASKHPVAGIAVTFASLAGGYSASFTPSIIDPIMQKFTENAAHIIDPSISINVLCNYFLSIGSTIGVVLLCWFVCEKIVEPYLQKNLPIDGFIETLNKNLSQKENRAFFFAFSSLLVLIAILAILAFPSSSILRGPNGSLTEKDGILMKGLVDFLFLFFAIPGLVFGFSSGKFKDSKEVLDSMIKALSILLPFIIFCFICSQFLYVFNNSNISKLIAISGAEFIKSLDLPRSITIFGIIAFTGFLNLFVASTTSKWAVLAPIFVPMLMILGISPELTQAAFRINDSAINIITPLFPFYPLIISFCQKYSSKTGVGTLCSMMLPFSLALMISLTITLYIFWWFEIPLGFESTYTYSFTSQKG